MSFDWEIGELLNYLLGEMNVLWAAHARLIAEEARHSFNLTVERSVKGRARQSRGVGVESNTCELGVGRRERA